MPRNLTRFSFMFVYIQKDEEEVISDQDQKVVDSCAIQVMNVNNTWTSWYTTNNNRVSFLILHEAVQHGGGGWGGGEERLGMKMEPPSAADRWPFLNNYALITK